MSENCDVLIVGDAMVDIDVPVTATRLAPEGPWPVCHAGPPHLRLGGAGNVFANVVAMGSSARLICVYGDSYNAVFADPRIRAITVPGVTTTSKTRFRSGTHVLQRLDHDNQQPVSRQDFLQRVLPVVQQYQPKVLVVSDYAKGLITDDNYLELANWANEQKIRLLVDPKPRPGGPDYCLADLVLPNSKELRSWARHVGCREIGTDDEVMQCLLSTVPGVDAIAVTRGADGILGLTGAGERHEVEANGVAIDVCGAGDVVTAVVASGWSLGRTFEECLLQSQLAAAIAVSRVGTAVVSFLDIWQARIRAGDYATKIVTPPQAKQIVGLHGDGCRAVLTNGCFDILHPGHIQTLRAASAAGDVLIVGVNSDASVTQNKGAGRPCQSAAWRMQVLSQLPYVDLVVEFDETSAIPLLELLRPDVYVKGADWRDREDPVMDHARRLGAETMYVDEVPECSTSQFLASLTR